jgi:7-cyano-7-deazaguanine reductase
MMGAMSKPSSKYPHLRQLGRAAPAPASPEKALLETVPSPDPGALFLVRFAAPEFTTLCAVTGQPDFAHLVIDYAPRAKLVESKSLKLYLGSFRTASKPRRNASPRITSRSLAGLAFRGGLFGVGGSLLIASR